MLVKIFGILGYYTMYSGRFVSRFQFQPWRQNQHIPPKCRYS